MARTVRIGRVYDDPDPTHGARILVDRLWPRGVRKDGACIDTWEKDVAPSAQLRTWYGHDPTRFEEFARRYRSELADPARTRALERLRQLRDTTGLTLLTATRDLEHSHAAVLAEVIQHAG